MIYHRCHSTLVAVFSWRTANILKKKMSSWHSVCEELRNVPELGDVLSRIRRIVPPLTGRLHKGQAGRIGVVGGSAEYTGAPYFATISALRVGADLVHVFCERPAATAIKCYSPELIVHPLLDLDDAVKQIEAWLSGLHVLIIGPGLSRNPEITKTVVELMKLCRINSKPMVLDAGALHVIKEYEELIKGYNKVILTPNVREFEALFGTDRQAIPAKIKWLLGQGSVVIEKGRNDIIHIPHTMKAIRCPSGGSGRRCGGQGDVLCGSIATFYWWALQSDDPDPAAIAAFAGSLLTKQCNAAAFEKMGRSTIASDLVNEIHGVFENYFESKGEGITN